MMALRPIPGRRPRQGPSPMLAMAARLGAFQVATAEAVIQKMRNYPPELPNQQYVRTYALHDAWAYTGPTFVGSDILVLTIINDATDRWGRYYARLVQGDYQTEIHRDRWESIYSPNVLNQRLWNSTLRKIMRTTIQSMRYY